MYANVRQYRMSAEQIDEAMHLADMATEDGSVCSMTIFEDREGAERSQDLAAKFVRDHLSGIEIEPTGGMTGEVMVSRAREQVLQPAHH